MPEPTSPNARRPQQTPGNRLKRQGNRRFNYDARGNRTYLFEPFSFKPLALVQHGEVFHYHTDHIGTPREITNARAEVVWSSTFKTYGALALAHVNEVENPLRFQGQYYDSETGLHYNRHRYYDPNCGQFTTQDPIGLLGGMNAYQYAPNPMTWVDPWGLSSKEECRVNLWNDFQKHHKGQFPNSSQSAAAYQGLKVDQSPWPINGAPSDAVILPGTKVNMAMSPGQPNNRPGGFATLDDIPDVEYVRNQLAVKADWKPQIDRVVQYEVTQPIPVKIGPVGPQIDSTARAYLPGGGNQIQFDVPPADRMKYLNVISETGVK
nr:RHS repeat-associated core domain-containing protein [Limnobacter parvus]